MDIIVRVAGVADAAAIAALRSLWIEDEEPGFERRMTAWLEAEGERRTAWLAELGGSAVGMASMLEYRRMPKPGRPDSRWGYVSNMFVRAEMRGRGVGSALLGAVVAAADGRGYARVVLAPSERAVAFYRARGFVVPVEDAGGDRLLVRPGLPPGGRVV
jgi:GNAT superfamily N-acetyltransferase